jgi:hypothetical protein
MDRYRSARDANLSKPRHAFGWNEGIAALKAESTEATLAIPHRPSRLGLSRNSHVQTLCD